MEQELIEQIRSLEKERDFISDILEMAGALVLVLDRRGRVVRFNKACEELTGYAFPEAKGRCIWDFLLREEEVTPVKAIFRNIRKGRFPDRLEGYWMTRYHGLRLIAWSGAPLKDKNGDIQYGVWVGLDITERKKMEEELRAGEERYRALIENVRDGVALIQDDRLAFANDACLSMFGYDDKGLNGMTLNRLVERHIEPGFMPFLKKVLAQKSWGLPYRGRCKTINNKEFWAEMLSTSITYKGRQAILITTRDITELMLWEMTIKQEAEYFRSENAKLKSSIGERYRLGDMIGKSRVMQEVYELILKAAGTDANVIIFGPSGTGKELAARAIHDMSDCSAGPFIPVNCGAIPENLIESEFFGYKKGAFTGAHMNKPGYLSTADKGSLFLDEVGDIGLNMQVKLLRAIEGGGFTPIGEQKPLHTDVRIIAATNKDLSQMVKSGRMRDDFFYRISVIPIQLPALADRREDIPLLAGHFLQSMGSDTERFEDLPAQVMDALMHHDWPGNVRELQNVLQRYITVKSLDFMKLPVQENPASPQGAPQYVNFEEADFKYSEYMAGIEANLLLRALEKALWNKTKAAALLGISRRSLFRRMHKLGINRPKRAVSAHLDYCK